MARTIDEIKELITTAYVANMDAIGITVDATTWSATNLMRLFIYIVAYCTFILETLFDIHTTDVDAQVKLLKPHTLRWYAYKSKLFQYGFNLLPDSDLYDNEGYTESEIEESKIVDYAAVIEQVNPYGRVSLRVKIAHDNGTDLEPVSEDEKTAFTEYITRIKDAGVRITIDSLPADNIKQAWRIYYDPLLLNSDLQRLDGTRNTPVQDAIKNYLKNLPFNGEYVDQYHIDAVQLVPGVVSVELDSNQAKYGLYDFTPINAFYTPDAGYLRFESDDDLTLTAIPKSAIK